jgi:hypothetical protein|tara:strand:- start:5831 stop:6610 length:780 start_codon:yes stop_codon:yes gene_type:complete
MADKKFSQFTNKATPTGNEQVVGLDAGSNVKLTINTIDRNNLSGVLDINNGGTGASVEGVATVGALLDEANQQIGDALVIQDDGSGNSVLATGPAVNIAPAGLQLVIAGDSGVSNTDNGVDFTVPYNTVRTNDDTSVYDTSVLGEAKVLKDGRYLVQARYSTFDLVQSNLPTVDGTKFLRITATVNGAKTCVFHNLLITTSVNGEAVATGSGIMDLQANDIVTITGFHTGATGGNGNQGFPVTNNNLFNEPMLWLIKIK